MRQENFTKEMLYRHLRKKWEDHGFPLAEGEHVGVVVSELVSHSNERNTQRELPYVDLWVAILDECISWFISLYLVVYGDRIQARAFSDFEKAMTLILGKIIADSTAMRHLILLGFDTSARTILRSLSEYMEVMVAMLHKPPFASEFVKSDTPEAAQRFWEQHLRGGKIRRKVTDAWNDFFGGSSDSAATWFANWGRSSRDILSGITHPSSAGGFFAIVTLKANHIEENWLGFWGDKADVSVDTVFIYAQFVFPILLLSRSFPFEGFEDHVCRTYDETKESHRHVRIGRDILASVIMSASSGNNVPYLFPELDMSFLPEKSKG